MASVQLKAIIVHGNNGGVSTDFWYPSTKRFLEKLGVMVINQTFPDNQLAHENIWLANLEKLGADANTIIIGHSSGAVAAMRFAQNHKIFGSVLVGVNYTDLGDETEKESGYYNHPWNWEKISANQNWIIQFASHNDPYIPISQPRFIAKKLNSEYYEYKDRGHFQINEFPELLEVLKKKCLQNN